ncbi:MAG: amidohydrolase [Sporomusaceae bacterium]|nr:amidohydrolase [Sporomusaceae bacterium]
MDQIHQFVQAIKDEIIQCRRDFHRYPESGWTEFRTAALIAQQLDSLGYTLKLGEAAVKQEAMLGVPSEAELAAHMKRAQAEGADEKWLKHLAGGRTGIVADLVCGEGPVVALRFDIDANDVQEAQDEQHSPAQAGFASCHDGVMHACGHDGHSAIGLAVAKVLASLKDQLAGTVRLIFQPGEEGSRGARAMVAAGAVDGVDYILGLHIGFQAQQTGTLICSTGKFLATTKYDVTYRGKPAHAAAAPEEGKNALLAAAACALNLHAISRHSQGATRITVGTLQAGQGRNVIPPNALMKLETRGETSELDEYMTTEARRIIKAAAAMYDVDCEITEVGGTKSGESSPELAAKVRAIASKMGFFQELIEYSAFGATEDFSHFMSVVQAGGGQGTYLMLGSELAAGHHNNYFNFNEEILAPGTELLVRTVDALIGSCQGKLS